MTVMVQPFLRRFRSVTFTGWCLLLQLSPEIAARIEREVMGDTMEGILERQEGIAREHYRKVLELGWKDKKLDVLRRIPSGRLAMLLENRELFRERDFADIPVSAAERKELPGELPWATFVVAIRVATDLTLTSDVVTNRLRALADELGLSEEQAVAIEHEVLGLVEAVVSPGSGGRFRTIGQALRKVRPGGRIRVRPGTYQESLVIDKPVDIVGEGPRQNIVIESWS